MDSRRQLLADLHEVLRLLDEMPPEEAAHGWDEPRIRNWHGVFSKLRSALLKGAPLRANYDGVVYVRGLDMDGIHSGRIFDAAIDIGRGVRELCGQEAQNGS